MPNTLELIHQIIPFIIKEQPDIERAMQHSAKVLSAQLNPKTKQLIHDHDFAESKRIADKHTTLILTSEAPPANTNAVYFGLFDMQGGVLKKYEHQRLYLCGSDNFDPDDEDWACDPSWFPSNRYYDIPLLNQIGKLQYAADSAAAYLLSLTFTAAYAINSAPLITRHTDPSTHPIPISAGHDAGDIFVLGYATPEGLQRP